MTDENDNGSPNGPSDTGEEERLTPEEAMRLVEEARKRGEDPSPIITRLVVQTIEDVQEILDADDRVS